MRGLSRSARFALRREQRRKAAGELNLVSMIDILTVLVFFLLVNSTGVAILGINLPDASKAPPADDAKRALSLQMRESGFTLLQGSDAVGSYGDGGSTVDYAALSEKLRTLKAAHPDETRITLVPEPGISHDKLVKTMDAVRVMRSEDGRQLLELFPAIALSSDPPPPVVPGAATGATP